MHKIGEDLKTIRYVDDSIKNKNRDNYFDLFMQISFYFMFTDMRYNWRDDSNKTNDAAHIDFKRIPILKKCILENK